jgi:hypothetical protein
MLMLLTVVAAPMPHFSTSPSRFTGLFGGVPNESFEAMGCGLLPPKILGGAVVGGADGCEVGVGAPQADDITVLTVVRV